jgi:hypothetical protein
MPIEYALMPSATHAGKTAHNSQKNNSVPRRCDVLFFRKLEHGLHGMHYESICRYFVCGFLQQNKSTAGLFKRNQLPQ